MQKATLLFSIIILFLYCQTKAQNIVPTRPSAPSKMEVKHNSCPTGYTWQGDEWKWDKQSLAYSWVPGKCLRMKKGHMWLPGQWTRAAKGWTWTPGKWRKI